MTDFQSADDTPSRPEDAAERLITILEGLPAFEPCRDRPDQWPDYVRHEYFPVWDLWPDAWRDEGYGLFRDFWFAYGHGRLVMDRNVGMPECAAVRYLPQPDMDRAVGRVLASPANSIPDGARDTLTRGWRCSPVPTSAQPAVFIRNVWHERRLLLKPIRLEIDRILPLAVRAVVRVDGNTEFSHRVKTDEFLHHETVDFALAQLNKALPQEGRSSSDPQPKGFTALLTGREAASAIGVDQATLSRWRKNVPVWASGNAVMFEFLMGRTDGKYDRRAVIRLAKWFKRAQEAGAQTPVECP